MLEVRDLRKTYKSKKGGDTEALKGINLKFADKGLVFILGKSGCGKSTLLNLLGGLDSFDCGEIIINGKSSKDFSPADFDSYRNTYLGFVFQEFNIIENFTIEKNIGLALQLQHKKSDKDAIGEILKKVELEGFSHRKPNELSGGQKQRVAIARALIKDPEIILADEPTGALDSATGKSVLTMLKKLANEKLVIIVSHDREFAEEYADRIVELKDGLVISDRTREIISDECAWKEEIIPISSEMIRIPKGKQLDEKTIQEINASLLNAKNDIYLMLGDEKQAEVAYPEKMQDIREKGYISAGSFSTTNENEIKSTKSAMKLIKSKLPWTDALKIGASNFKAKKFRLVLTIFLSVLSLIFFGFADIFASYDKSLTYTKSFYEGNAYYMAITKKYEVTEVGSSWSTVVPFSASDVKELDQYFNGKTLNSYNFESYSVNANFYKSSNDKFFQPSYYQGFLEAKYDDSMIAYGNYPKDFTEIMISDYMAKGYLDLSMAVQTNEGAKEYVFPSYEQIIGTIINIDNVDYTISGIFKTNFYSLYNKLIGYNEKELNEDEEAIQLNEAYRVDERNIYNKIIVKDGFSDYLKSKLSMYYANIVPDIQPVVSDEYFYRDSLPIILDDTGTLQRGQIILPASYYNYTKHGGESTKTYKELEKEFLAPQNILCYVPVLSWINESADNSIFQKEYEVVGIYKDINFFENTGNNGDDVIIMKDIAGPVIGKPMPVPGGYWPGDNSQVRGIIMCKEDFMEVLEETYAPQTIYADARLSGEDLYKSILYLHENNYEVSARNEGALSTADMLMEQLLKVFYIVSGVLAIFVMLLLYNFISMSVVNKKKEIGILRAIGARGQDVASIFIFEALIIGLIILVIAIPSVIILGDVLQAELLDAINAKIISFGIRQVFTMSGLTLLILVLSSLLPVLKISKKKPIDAILNK